MREAIIIIMFDLPTQTPLDRRKYARFRSGLKRLGYQIFQKSVYYKLLMNVSTLPTEVRNLMPHLPEDGNVHLLPIPLGTFRKLIPLLGNTFDFARLTQSVIEIE